MFLSSTLHYGRPEKRESHCSGLTSTKTLHWTRRGDRRDEKNEEEGTFFSIRLSSSPPAASRWWRWWEVGKKEEMKVDDHRGSFSTFLMMIETREKEKEKKEWWRSFLFFPGCRIQRLKKVQSKSHLWHKFGAPNKKVERLFLSFESWESSSRNEPPKSCTSTFLARKQELICRKAAKQQDQLQKKLWDVKKRSWNFPCVELPRLKKKNGEE